VTWFVEGKQNTVGYTANRRTTRNYSPTFGYIQKNEHHLWGIDKVCSLV